MEILELKHEDLNQLVELIAMIKNEQSDDGVKAGEEYKEAFLTVLNNDRVRCFGAMKNGQLVGWIGVYRHWEPDYSHCAQLELGVLLDEQDQGIGKALLSQALEWASTHGLKRIELTVRTKNKRALWLFSRFGFSVEGTRKQVFQEGDMSLDEFYMGLLLKEKQSER